METLYFKLFGRNPYYSGLKILGYKCYSYLQKQGQSKFNTKPYPCVFIGYCLLYKGYRCLDNLKKRVYILRHVVFDEIIFPFVPTNSPSVSKLKEIFSSHHVFKIWMNGPHILQMKLPKTQSGSDNDHVFFKHI